MKRISKISWLITKHSIYEITEMNITISNLQNKESYESKHTSEN